MAKNKIFNKIFYLQDIISEDESRTKSWRKVATTHGIMRSRGWFAAVCQAIPKFPPIETNNIDEQVAGTQAASDETQEDEVVL